MSAAKLCSGPLQYVSCSRCCGVIDFDEEGQPYTCFACCDTGLMSPAQAAEYAGEWTAWEQATSLDTPGA